MVQPLSSLALHHEATARVLERYQIRPADIFKAAGLDAEPYRDVDTRISLARVRKIWSEAARLTGNPEIGFEVGAAVRAGNLHAVGFAWLASRTLKDAMDRLIRHQRLLSSAMEIDLLTEGGEVIVQYDADPRWPPQGCDAFATAIIAVSREVTYEDFTPERVELARNRPQCAAWLRSYYGCPTSFDTEHNRFVFRASQVTKFLPRQNPAIAQASDEVAHRYIALMDRGDVLTRARVGLIEILANGDPTRIALAEHLHMSERTLSRRLRDAGTTFRQLLDGVREDLGKDYIRQTQYTISDVCYLLGFKDQSNFAKAFRRWTGTSPSAFRDEMLAQDGTA